MAAAMNSLLSPQGRAIAYGFVEPMLLLPCISYQRVVPANAGTHHPWRQKEKKASAPEQKRDSALYGSLRSQGRLVETPRNIGKIRPRTVQKIPYAIALPTTGESRARLVATSVAMEADAMTARAPSGFLSSGVEYSLPPCGGGLGRGVSRKLSARGYPPLQLSPTRGERAGRVLLQNLSQWKRTR
jgi:hypothetical protein